MAALSRDPGESVSQVHDQPGPWGAIAIALILVAELAALVALNMR